VTPLNVPRQSLHEYSMGHCCCSETEEQTKQRVRKEMDQFRAELDIGNARFNAIDKEISEASTVEEQAAIAKKYGFKWPPPRALS
jgi:hypothetical protein